MSPLLDSSRPETQPPELVRRTLPPSQLLDWRDREHWSGRRLCCRLCGHLTNLRDEDGTPMHKVCAEQDRTQR